MQTIIQMSDFHIKATMCEPHKNTVFTKLVETIKLMELENIILVYNGDVVDAKSIGSTIDDNLTDIEKKLEWDKNAEIAYSKAKQYFDYLTNQLSIPNNRIVICCGNHDVNPYGTLSNNLTCPDKTRTVLFDPSRFLKFAKFCDSIQSKKNTYGTYCREIDNINFLIVNSNWINKWRSKTERQPLCIDCNGIINEVGAIIEKLERTKKEKSKLCNVLVAHAPCTDYCESSLYSYPDNDYHAAMALIDRFYGLKLYGDKHTDSIHSFDYIVGAPLDDDRISCGIHIFDSEYHHHHKLLMYSDNEWKIIGSEDDVSSILEISEDSLKDKAFEYLWGAKEISDIEQRILDFDNTCAGDNWIELDHLLRASADIQKPQKIGAGIPISAKDGFINTLTRIISDSHKKVCLTIRGRYRLGKSVCMTLLYLNLLHRFISGTFEYLPMYIDVEHIMQLDKTENRDSTQYIRRIRKAFQGKLGAGIELGEKFHRPICCIIDGLGQYFVYNNAKIEQMIDEELEQAIGGKNARLLYCINTGNKSDLGSTPQDVRKDAEYLVYFNTILTKKAYSNGKYKMFIRAFAKLRNSTSLSKDVELVTNNIERMHILEIDTNLLVNFWDKLTVINNDTFFSLIESYVQNQIGVTNIKGASEACFLYYNKTKNYIELKRICRINNSTFEFIRTQQVVADYLLALNYILHIQEYEREKNIDESLNVLYNHDVCVLIREYICKYSIQAQIIRYAKEMYIKLLDGGRATITYLLGRIGCDQDSVAVLLKEQNEIIFNEKTPLSLQNRHFRSVALRSIRISRIFVEQYSKNYLNEYIQMLISDAYERKINRVFYLQFYGDRENDWSDTLMDGFDIYNTYHIIASRLKHWKETNEMYALLDLELFTLSDMIQIRLDCPTAKTNRENKSVSSFFYNKKLNKPNDDMAVNVLSFVVEIINRYLESYGNIHENRIFIKYLSVQLKVFRNHLQKIEVGPLNADVDSYNANILLKELIKLETVNRVGWNIPNIIEHTIKEEDYLLLQNQSNKIETTLIHTYEAYLIGLLYLPNTSASNDNYNKQKILNMILIHDMGESQVGDIIPAYAHYELSRKAEREFCELLFLQGIHDNVSDLSEYFDLWEDWCDNDDNYNIRIAKEIDCIQMLYKLLTLIKNQTVELTEERIHDFWSARKRIKTLEGREIFDMLLINDPEFQEILKKYGLTI